MENDAYKFYERKSKIFWLLVACILLLLGSYFISKSVVPKERLAGYVGLVLFGMGLIAAIIKMLSNKAYVEITPTYIKIGNFEKLLWKDVTDAYIVQIRGAKLFYFSVADVAEYKLTFWQKVNYKLGYPPFYIPLSTFSADDLNKLQQLIKQYAPQISF